MNNLDFHFQVGGIFRETRTAGGRYEGLEQRCRTPPHTTAKGTLEHDATTDTTDSRIVAPLGPESQICQNTH